MCAQPSKNSDATFPRATLGRIWRRSTHCCRWPWRRFGASLLGPATERISNPIELSNGLWAGSNRNGMTSRTASKVAVEGCGNRTDLRTHFRAHDKVVPFLGKYVRQPGLNIRRLRQNLLRSLAEAS